jgi:hypothetical protein
LRLEREEKYAKDDRRLEREDAKDDRRLEREKKYAKDDRTYIVMYNLVIHYA